MDNLTMNLARRGFELIGYYNPGNGHAVVMARRETNRQIVVWWYRMAEDALDSGSYYPQCYAAEAIDLFAARCHGELSRTV